MKKYNIEVIRTGYSSATIEVEAESLEQARELAIENAPYEDFGREYYSEYEIKE